MKTRFVLILFAAIFCFFVSSTNAQTTETVIVNFGIETGPVLYRASGFLGDLTDTQPPDSVFLPLKPKLISWVKGWAAINRAMQNGIMYQRKLRNMGAIPSDPINGDWSTWEGIVRTVAQDVKTKNYKNVEFDIWNEPEYGQYWTGAIDERYFQMWIRAYRTIKSVDPTFVVAGPSSTNFGWTKDVFLTRMFTENTVPDVLTFHELFTSGNGLANRVTQMRNLLASKGYPNWKISINEYDDSSTARKPGALMRFFYELELAKVHSAAKACWQEGGDWNCQIHLNNTLTYPDQKPRSAWWTYKAYADMTGTLVNVTNSQNFVALASKDTSTNKGYILVGNTGINTSFKINISNISSSPFYTSGSSVKAIIHKIPNTESLPLIEPILHQTLVLTPTNNSLEIQITGASAYDVYSIVLEAGGSAPSPTNTPTPLPVVIGDVDGDGDVDINDYNILVLKFGQNYPQADFNGSGLVDIYDYNSLLGNL